jgi:hypothetical protein
MTTQETTSEYITGKIIHRKDKNFQVLVRNKEDMTNKIDCYISYFCPAEVGDNIAFGDYTIVKKTSKRKTGNEELYMLQKEPLVIIGKDQDTIKNVIFRIDPKCFKIQSRTAFGGFKIYDSLVEDSKKFGTPGTPVKHLDYINDMSCRYVSLKSSKRMDMIRTRFKEFDSKLVKKFLTFWYENRVLRSFFLFGFTKTEIKTSQKFHSCSRYVSQLFQDFIENPYIFFTIKPEKIDRIALSMGKDSEQNKRVYSALREIYEKFEFGQNGYSIEKFVQLYPNMLETIDPWIVQYKGNIYFKHIFNTEKEISERLQKIASNVLSYYCIEEDELLTENPPFSSDQIESVIGALRSPIGIISGPAGSGKTTILKKIVDVIEMAGDKVAIAAFTGKAVDRLRQVLNREDPQTLHHLLMTDVEFDALIIDEASMVSSSLLHQVLMKFEHHFNLYMIGDVSQLPPIEWGRPFYDLIQTKKVPTYFLTKGHRFDKKTGEESSILVNGKGMIENKNWKWKEDEFFQILNYGGIKQIVQEMIENDIPMNDFTILSPFNKELDKINQMCSEMFLPKAKCVIDPIKKIGWRIGDRVINLKNRYDLENPIMNGMDGEIVDFTQHGVKVNFPNNGKDFCVEFLYNSMSKDPFEDSDEEDDIEDHDSSDEKSPPTTKHLAQSYAMSIHKAQGSEWKKILIYIPYDKPEFITKNLFYTGVTRAKEKLWIISSNGYMLNQIPKRDTNFGNDALIMLY